jgi:site-specific recombinase XerD
MTEHDTPFPTNDPDAGSEIITQPSLFQTGAPVPVLPASPMLARPQPLTAESSLAACAIPYQQYLQLTDHSNYTVTCFLSDLHLMMQFLGSDTPVGRITTQELTDWLMFLRWRREHRPAPKSMARRATFLKNFFGWLLEEGVIAEDPATGIALSRPLPPLPELLFEDEVARLVRAAENDSRCACLVLLILYAGLKKEEVMGLKIQHFDLSDPEHPAVSIHFPGQAKRRRERRMALPAAFTPVLRRYLDEYRPQDQLFPYTDRNLNYILARAVQQAGIKKRVTLQLLRDIYAVRELHAGTPPDELREKLGLSEEAWRESYEKYRKLAFPL